MTKFKVRDPDYEARVRESFGRQPFMATIGAALRSVEPGRVAIEVPCEDHITQQHGFIHGGVVGAIADNAAGYAAYSLMDSEDTVLTVEYKLNLLVPAKGDRIVAQAEVMRPGRTLTIVRSDVSAIDGDKETVCATSVVTIIRMAGKSDRASG